MREDAVSIPAATVIVMRDRVDGPPELLMVERAQSMAFAGGALVFPGGRIDPGDRLLAAMIAPDDVDEAAHRIAAIRETIEEAGIALALDPAPDTAALAEIRARLHAGDPFAAALTAAGTTIVLDQLVPLARWLPTGLPHRVFDTRFYLAQLAPGAPDPVADQGETTRAFWATAADVLAQADAGRATIIFPTRRNLERLAQHRSHAEAVADARAHPVRPITPWVEDHDGTAHLCIPDDLGYPVVTQRLRDARRS